jgi:hypothetical protein
MHSYGEHSIIDHWFNTYHIPKDGLCVGALSRLSEEVGFYEAGYFWLLQDAVTPVESMVMDSPISFAEILGWIPYMWMGHFARIAVLGEAVWMGKT